MRDIIIDLQEFHTWKIQLTIASKGAKEERLIHLNSDNTKFTFYNDANKVVVELFKSFCSIYPGNSETSMRGIDFIFDSIQLMYYKCHKINFRSGGSYIDSLQIG